LHGAIVRHVFDRKGFTHGDFPVRRSFSLQGWERVGEMHRAFPERNLDQWLGGG
jgi:hypothetical protein